MADPPKLTPTFSLGQATSSSGGKALFGSSTSSAPPSSIFGSTATATAPTSTSGGLFGSTTASTAPPGSLFGADAGAPAASSPFGGASNGNNVFGTPNKPSTGGGFNFGPSTSTSTLSGVSSQPGSQAGQPASNAPSGLFSTPSKPTDTPATSQTASNPFGGASAGGLLFGSKAPSSDPNTTTPVSKQTTSIFGNSTTPAGPPPGASMGPGAAPLFSVNKPDGQSNAPSSNVFGGLGRTTGDSTSKKQSTPSLFAPPSGPVADVKKPEASQAPSQTSNVFGAPHSNANTGSGIFGMTPTVPQSQPPAGFFNNQNQPQNVASSKPAGNKPTPSLFANLGGPSTSDSQPASTTSTPSLFPSASKQPSTPSFSFAKPPGTAAASSGTVKSPMAATAAGLFGNLGASNAATSSGASALSATASKTSLFPGLSQSQDNSADATGTTTTSSGAPSALASSMFSSLGKPSAPSASSQSQTLSTTTPADANKSTTNLGASTVGPAPPARSRLKDKTMDDIITRWASDLSKYQVEFQAQAEKVASWDRMLVENSEKIQRLYGSTLEAERATTEVERQLTSVESDQAELESWLSHYEAEVNNMIQNQVGQGDGLSGPDQERERTYQLATRLSDRLDDMGKDLGSMIEEINDASSNLSKHAKSDDPLTQVVRVLNSHLTQLQQIDQGAASLQLKVKEAQKAGQGMGPPSGLSGPSSDAAEGFYRSYMGRG